MRVVGVGVGVAVALAVAVPQSGGKFSDAIESKTELRIYAGTSDSPAPSCPIGTYDTYCIYRQRLLFQTHRTWGYLQGIVLLQLDAN